MCLSLSELIYPANALTDISIESTVREELQRSQFIGHAFVKGDAKSLGLERDLLHERTTLYIQKHPIAMARQELTMLIFRGSSGLLLAFPSLRVASPTAPAVALMAAMVPML